MSTLSRLVSGPLAAAALVLAAAPLLAAEPDKPYQPTVGQAGKDVVWVPTPPVLVEKMLDMAGVGPGDFVIDLGSGDGRIVIAAARRGARALGVEYNPDLVEFSRRAAHQAGVGDRAEFMQGDMFEANISHASVLALFLLTENLNRLVPKFLALRPGARIVVNGFLIDGWTPDETGRAEGDCGTWCTAYLYIVPAQVAGSWRLEDGTLELEQKFQTVSGTLAAGGAVHAIREGRLRGEEIRFRAGGVEYVGRVRGHIMRGERRGGASGTWSAVRVGGGPAAGD